MAGPATVEEYLAALPTDRRTAMEELRRTIRAAVPDAVESIAYSMPAFKTPHGELIVSYAAYKRHYSLFPANQTAVSTLGDEIAPFFARKATLHFPVSGAIPTALVTKVVKIRAAEVGERGERGERGEPAIIVR